MYPLVCPLRTRIVPLCAAIIFGSQKVSQICLKTFNAQTTDCRISLTFTYSGNDHQPGRWRHMLVPQCSRVAPCMRQMMTFRTVTPEANPRQPYPPQITGHVECTHQPRANDGLIILDMVHYPLIDTVNAWYEQCCIVYLAVK